MIEGVNKLALGLASKKEEILRSAINFALGREDWTLEEIRDRAHFVSYADSPDVQFFTFDNVPLVEIHKEQISMSDDYKLTATFNYRYLYKQGAANQDGGEENDSN